MMKVKSMTGLVAALTATALLCAGNAFADKPDWAGGGKDGRHERKERDGGRKGEGREVVRAPSSGSGPSVSVSVYFGDRHRTAVHDYYGRQFRAGHCPPGLAKKRNGCMPPGQAKQWRIGRPLPRDVIFHDLPPAVLVELGPPPSGHRFVRVAADILLIAVGTAMVVDAIEDLGRM